MWARLGDLGGVCRATRGKALADTQKRIKVTQSKLPDSQVGLEIEIPQDRTRQAYDQAVTKMMRTAQIPGFRKGKVPRKVILRQFGGTSLNATVLEELVQQTFDAALKQEEIDILGNVELKPEFEELITQFTPGETLTYQVTADVLPDVQLKRYQDFKLTAEEVKFDPKQADEVLDLHRSRQATLVPVEDRTAQVGDVVLIDFVNRTVPEPEADDQASAADATETTENEEVKDFQLELAEDAFLPDLVAGIVGMSIDETKEIPVQLPENLVEEGGSQSSVFTVTLTEIKIKELPELDDDFAQNVSEFATLAELRQFLEEQHQQEAQDKTETNVSSALLDALLEELEVELPATLIQEETNILIKEQAAQLQAQGIDVNQILTEATLPRMQAELRPQAIKRLKCTLALVEVAKRESIEVDSDALDTRIQEVNQEMGSQIKDQERLRAVVEEDLLKQQVIDWLQEHSEVTLVASKAEEDTSATDAAVAEDGAPGTSVAADDTLDQQSDTLELASETSAEAEDVSEATSTSS